MQEKFFTGKKSGFSRKFKIPECVEHEFFALETTLKVHYAITDKSKPFNRKKNFYKKKIISNQTW